MTTEYLTKITVHNKKELLEKLEDLFKNDRGYICYRRSVHKAVELIPDYLFPIKVKATDAPIPSTEEDWLTWKRLYEEAGLVEDDIAVITGWTSATVRRGLHKLNVKTTRKRREYRSFY
ncbi:MAG: hypothetical protein ABIM21_07685 [candidate division WOR-3 bacterium]